MPFLDFDLFIERSGVGYCAQVLNSPAGQAIREFNSSFSEVELNNFLLRIVPKSQGVFNSSSQEIGVIQTFGSRLFETVFGGRVLACLHSSLDEAHHQRKGLRIRLHLAEVPELANWPWEYLYHPTLDHFLALYGGTSLVRYLDLPERVQPLTIRLPLRILVMISCPQDSTQFSVEQEWTNLNQALDNLIEKGLVVLERLEKATLTMLFRQLRRGEYHIFHFIGQGGFDQQAEDGILILENELGRSRRVSGQHLGMLLHDHGSLRLVILDACEARSSSSDPFAGAAPSLVQLGIPAVITMQFEVTDKSAITLAHDFYSAIADNCPVDGALVRARKAIFAQSSGVDWGSPILYMRARDGCIFKVEESRQGERLQTQVAALRRKAQEAMIREDWKTAIEALQAALVLDPDNVEVPDELEQAEQQQSLKNLYDMRGKHDETGKGLVGKTIVQAQQLLSTKFGLWLLLGILAVSILLLLIPNLPKRSAHGPTFLTPPTNFDQMTTVSTQIHMLPSQTPIPLPDSPSVRSITIGQSVKGEPLEVTQLGRGPSHIVFVGGIHAGYAPATSELAESTINYFSSHYDMIPPNVTLHIIVNANPDSPYAPGRINGRLNANGVDLNRNWDCNWKTDAVWGSYPVSGGSSPLSEPETRALYDYFADIKPNAVVFWEAKMAGGLASPGGCDTQSLVSESLAKTYGYSAGYKVEPFKGYDLNGDATNSLDDQGIPTISVLLPDYISMDWSSNLKGILAVLDHYSD